jgi:peptidoglycan/xylan/chitin deacetylase (PgdA/CDA1 family)
VNLVRRVLAPLPAILGIAIVAVLLRGASEEPARTSLDPGDGPSAALVVPSPSPAPSPGVIPPSPAPTLDPVIQRVLSGPSMADRPSGPPVARLPRIPPGAVPILYYHRVVAPPASFVHWKPAKQRAFLAYDVLPSAFAAQLDWLVEHGYTTILPRDLAAHWDHGAPLPARPVMLTFDDGTHDWTATVLPMLRQRGMVAEFYLTLSAIANHSITWREVRRLAAARNGIGAHDVHHVQLAALGRGRRSASVKVMWAEVHRARQVIAAHVGVAPDSMAYVGGGFDRTLERLVRKAGYRTARSIVRGIVQVSRQRFALRVVRIGVHDDVTDVVAGGLAPGLPVFVARMHGVSDKRRTH